MRLPSSDSLISIPLCTSVHTSVSPVVQLNDENSGLSAGKKFFYHRVHRGMHRGTQRKFEPGTSVRCGFKITCYFFKAVPGGREESY